jgi:ribA/ribD-fused uncharacterized protein
MQIVNGFFGKHRFLSNFHLEPVVFDGMTYCATENAYQAAKTLDLEDRKRFQDVAPRTAKRLGRSVSLRPDWDAVRIDVMRTLQREKFKPGSDLSQRLLDTGDAVLLEANYWGDCFWGVCRGAGESWLGTLLMERREELRQFADLHHRPLPLEEIQRQSKEAIATVADSELVNTNSGGQSFLFDTESLHVVDRAVDTARLMSAISSREEAATESLPEGCFSPQAILKWKDSK